MVQSWYPPGNRAKYWIIVPGASDLPSTGDLPELPPRPAEDELPELVQYPIRDELDLFEPLEQLEREEIARLALQDEEDALWDAEVEQSNTTPWLQYTKWPQ